MSDISFAPTRTSTGLASLLLLSLRVHAIFFVIPLAYLVTNLILLSGIEGYHAASMSGLVLGMMSFTIPAGLVAVFLFRLLQYVTVIKPESPVKQMGSDLKSLFTSPSIFIMGIPLFAAMVLFNKGMLELKPLIPKVIPFSWDVAFMELDRALHFGIDPWRILQPIMGFDTITFMTSNFYNFWFLALFGCFIWFGFARTSSVNRTQFFLAYMLTWWIGGGLMAVYFSSAGPVYYGNLGLTPDPFTDLMGYLRDVNTRMPILSLETQALLWDGYTGKGPAIGISAFPSMHNASTILFALATWKKSRALGWAFAVYTLIILAGSVHLGWHYAVDGYAGLALAAACWWVAGIWARRHHSQSSTQLLNEALASR